MVDVQSNTVYGIFDINEIIICLVNVKKRKYYKNVKHQNNPPYQIKAKMNLHSLVLGNAIRDVLLFRSPVHICTTLYMQPPPPAHPLTFQLNHCITFQDHTDTQTD